MLPARWRSYSSIFDRYPAFSDTHGNHKDDLPKGTLSHNLEDELRKKGKTKVYFIGAAGAIWVVFTTIDVAKLGSGAFAVEQMGKR